MVAYNPPVVVGGPGKSHCGTLFDKHIVGNRVEMVSGFVKDFECLIERVPKELPVWGQLGRGDPLDAIAEANYEPGRLLSGKSFKQANEHREALGWMVYWLTRYGNGSQARTAREYSLNDLSGIEEAWSVAKLHKKVKDLLSEVRCGVRGVEYEDDAIRLPYERHPDLGLLQEALPLMHAGELLNFPFPNLEPMWNYFHGGKVERLWFRAPAAIRTVARQASRQISRQGPSYVDPGLQTPIGVTLGELINYWNELSAISLYDHTVMQRTKSPSRVVYPRRQFVLHMAKEAGISQQEADEITAKLTINRRGNSTHDRVAQHNPQLRPFVQVEGGLFLPSTLTVPSMGQQRTTKLLQVAYPGNLSGRLRQQLGDEGEKRVFDLLKERLRSDVLIAKNVLVYRGNTRAEPATDLDVVVYVPGELLVVIQVKWHVMVNSQYEAYYQQERARRGRQDLETLRDQMDAGTVQVQWPPEWGKVDADRCERKWFVLTHDTMPVHDLDTSDIKMRSLILIQHLLPRNDHSARNLVEVMDCPPTPTVGEPLWETIKYGDWTIRVERSTFHPDQPAPFTDIPAILHQRNTMRPPSAPEPWAT